MAGYSSYTDRELFASLKQGDQVAFIVSGNAMMT